MRLQMHDTNNTVLTSLDTEILRKADHDGKEYFYYITVNGLTLKYYGNDKQKKSQSDFNKLLTKGAKKQYEAPYIDEQEEAHYEAIAQDLANEDLHGHVVSTTLAGKYSSCTVWDFYKQKHVEKGQETKVVTKAEAMQLIIDATGLAFRQVNALACRYLK